MVELGNMKIITSAIAVALMWHVQCNLFSLLELFHRLSCLNCAFAWIY